MFKRFIIYMGVLLGALYGLCLWKNYYSYGHKPWYWKLSKSLLDSSLIAVLAWKLPGLLIAYAVNWAAWPIKNRNVRTAVSVLAGLAFNAIHGTYLEVLALVSVFSIDLVTGQGGLTGQLEHEFRQRGLRSE